MKCAGSIAVEALDRLLMTRAVGCGRTPTASSLVSARKPLTNSATTRRTGGTGHRRVRWFPAENLQGWCIGGWPWIAFANLPDEGRTAAAADASHRRQHVSRGADFPGVYVRDSATCGSHGVASFPYVASGVHGHSSRSWDTRYLAGELADSWRVGQSRSTSLLR